MQRVTIGTIKRRYREVNPHGHWFDRDTMRFFNSRLATHGWRNEHRSTYYFVSSERYNERSPRLYSVRALRLPSGNVDTLGSGFQGYATLAQAERACRIACENEA